MIVSRRTAVALAACVAATLGGAVAAQPAGADTLARTAEDATAGTYVPLTPARVLDTRTGLGGTTPAAHGTVALKVTGVRGVPSTGVSAVALTVTAASAPAGGYVTAYPAGTARPTASNVNFAKGQTVANLTTARVGTGGVVDLYNGSTGRTPLVADVSGYWTDGTPSAAGAFVPVNPARILDTRSKLGGSEPAGHGQVLLQVGGKGGVPTAAGAVTLTVTATGGTASGSVSVYPDDGSYHAAVSNLNFAAGGTAADQVVVSVPADGKVVLVNGSAKPVHLVADVAGYYLPGQARTPGTLTATAPQRFLDTRSDDEHPEPAGKGVVALNVAGRSALPPTGISAVVLTVTVTAPQASGYLTAYAGGTARPTASNLNFAKGQTVADLVIVPVSAGGVVNFYNGSSGKTQVVVDVAGYYSSVSNPWTTTTPDATTDPKSGSSFNGVSCPTASSCVAIGTRHTQSPFSVGPFIETLADGSWTRLDQDPPASDVERELSAVSCVSATSCVAVGYDHDDGSSDDPFELPVVEQLSDGAWSAAELPAPPVHAGDDLQSAVLNGVSCTSTNNCVAVGSYFTGSQADQMLVETFDGASWTPTELSLPKGTTGGLDSVSCATATDCVAVGGTAVTSSGKFYAVIERLAGGTWTRDATLSTNDTYTAGEWSGVSCTAADHCVAVSAQRVAATLSGTAWTTTAIPLGFTSVSCTSATTCTAAGGYYADRAGDTQPEVADLDNGAWTQFGLPRTGASGTLSGIACTDSTSCVAVGQENVYVPGSIDILPLIESRAGS